MKKTKVAIIKKEFLLRECLAFSFKGQPEFEVIGHWESSRDALPYLADNAADVLILDLAELRGGDMAGLPYLRTAVGQAMIMILTSQPSLNELRMVFKQGATGYISQNISVNAFFDAVRSVARGNTYVPFEVKEQLVSSYLERCQIGELKVMMELTPREQQVLRLLAQGYKAREAANQLGLSHKTVETYKYRLMTKLCLSNHADLMQYAAGMGWLQFESRQSVDLAAGAEPPPGGSFISRAL